MSSIKLKQENVLKAFKGADTAGKKLLQDLVGDQLTLDQKITDIIKTFEDACECLNINKQGLGLDIMAGLPDGKALVAFAKLSIIRRAMNDDC